MASERAAAEATTEAALTSLRAELSASAADDRETALAALAVELEAEGAHARAAAVAEARRAAEGSS